MVQADTQQTPLAPIHHTIALNSVSEAAEVCSYLQVNGVDAQLLDDNILSIMPHYSICVGGVKVVVPSEQETAARTLMTFPPELENQYLDSPMDGDDDEAPPADPCPQCGGDTLRNQPYSPRILVALFVFGVLLFPFSVLIIPPLLSTLSYWSCSSCGWSGTSRDLL